MFMQNKGRTFGTYAERRGKKEWVILKQVTLGGITNNLNLVLG